MFFELLQIRKVGTEYDMKWLTHLNEFNHRRFIEGRYSESREILLILGLEDSYSIIDMENEIESKKNYRKENKTSYELDM